VFFIKVLSLFDGMSCLQLAFKGSGIKVDEYFASEIDVNSIKVTQKNFPETKQLGDITKLSNEDLKLLQGIDFLGGGSPCQNLSISVINNTEHNQGLKGDKSKLFFEYLRVLREVKPKYFLYENVASMKKKDKDVITELLGVEPLMIDSNLLTAQDRKRYYWTNIPRITQPEDKNLVINDILESNVDKKYYYDAKEYTYLGEDKKIEAMLNINCHDIGKRIYNKNNKCGTLTACRGGYRQKKILDNGVARKLTPLEYERLQGVPENYTEGVADSHRYNMLGDGWTVPIISHILNFIK